MRQEAPSQLPSTVRNTDSRRDGEPNRNRNPQPSCDREGAVIPIAVGPAFQPVIESRTDLAPTQWARATPGRVSITVVIVLGILFAATAIFAWSRGGLFDLPSVPGDVTLQAAGLAGLNALKSLEEQIEIQPRRDGRRAGSCVDSWPLEAGFGAYQVYHGLRDVRMELEAQGLWKISDGVRFEPDNLVLANFYRMEVFRLRRAFLMEARRRGEIAPQFPPHLDRQPIVFFEELVKKHPSRETKLSLALAWVDEMLLFPALEIKAPSSVQAVDILTEVLNEPGNEWYVPALFARGLNHLHRPARLVWPESAKTPKDAAVQDIAKCVAIGRRLGVGSVRLQATLAMTLGDAYVKAGRFGVARSWWQIAQNLCHEDDVQQAIRRRYAWNDEEILDRLEEELDRARSELDHPMTDLALMWN